MLTVTADNQEVCFGKEKKKGLVTFSLTRHAAARHMYPHWLDLFWFWGEEEEILHVWWDLNEK